MNRMRFPSGVVDSLTFSNNNLWLCDAVLFARLQCFPDVFSQSCHKSFFIFSQSFLDFSPSGWTILVFHAYNIVNDLVNLTPILTCHFYSSFLENLIKMPEVTGNRNSPQHSRTCACMICSLRFQNSSSSDAEKIAAKALMKHLYESARYVAARLGDERFARFQVANRIKMNKRLDAILGQRVAEKRGKCWALTSFIRSTRDSTKEESDVMCRETRQGYGSETS